MTFPTPAHLHLLLNHLPIIGTAGITLLLLLGLLRRSRDLTVTALVLTIILSASAWFIQETGEEAEEQIEQAVWFSETALHEHEESAERATIALTIAAVLAAGALFRRRSHPDDRTVASAAFVVLVVATVLYGITGKTGGVIRHADEIGATLPAGGGDASDD